MPGPSFQLGERRTLFRLGDDLYLVAQGHYTPFDISPDDRRFLMAREVRSAAEAAPTFLIVENWFTELKAKVPAQLLGVRAHRHPAGGRR